MNQITAETVTLSDKVKRITETKTEATALLERLSDERAKELLDYARYLAEKEDDEEWDRIVEKSTKSPKFAALVEDVKRDIREGRTEPLDESRF
jgi:hypothetical protein